MHHDPAVFAVARLGTLQRLVPAIDGRLFSGLGSTGAHTGDQVRPLSLSRLSRLGPLDLVRASTTTSASRAVHMRVLV